MLHLRSNRSHQDQQTNETQTGPANRWMARVQLLMVLIGDALLVVALHGLGTTPLFQVDWTARATWAGRDPIPVLADLGRLAALAMAYWVAGVLLVHLARAGHRRLRTRSSLTPSAPPSQLAQMLMLPSLRHLAERAVGPALAVSVLASSTLMPTPASAADDAPPIPVVVEVDVESGDDGPDSGLQEIGGLDSESDVEPATPFNTPSIQPRTPLPVLGESGTITAGLPIPSAGLEASAGLQPESSTDLSVRSDADGIQAQDQDPGLIAASTWHTVQPGDCIWDIAVAHFLSVDAMATDADLAQYWADTVAANRDSIRSGNPDLIFPGETIDLPEIHR